MLYVFIIYNQFCIFEDVNETIRNAMGELKTITLEGIQRCFQKWQECKTAGSTL